jgi:hypothetical protein
MNKPKLSQLFKTLGQKTDALSAQNQVVEVFKEWDQGFQRSTKISLPQA